MFFVRFNSICVIPCGRNTTFTLCTLYELMIARENQIYRKGGGRKGLLMVRGTFNQGWADRYRVYISVQSIQTNEGQGMLPTAFLSKAGHKELNQCYANIRNFKGIPPEKVSWAGCHKLLKWWYEQYIENMLNLIK